MMLQSAGYVLSAVLSSGKVAVPSVSAVMKLMVSWWVRTSDQAKSAECRRGKGCVSSVDTQRTHTSSELQLLGRRVSKLRAER